MALIHEDIIMAVWWNDVETCESGQKNKSATFEFKYLQTY